MTSSKVPGSGEKVLTAANNTDNVEVESVKCACCSLTEECTPAYIAKVRERYHGRWICGLCSEAVKDEVARSGWLISIEEAMDRHITFSNSFRSSSKPPPNPKKHLISVMKQVMLRSLDSPRSVPASPRERKLTRSGSCFPSIAG